MFYRVKITENDDVNPTREMDYVVKAENKREALRTMAANLSNWDISKIEIVGTTQTPILADGQTIIG